MRPTISLLLAFSLTPQDAGFEANARLVLVPVTVTDAKGRSVDGLETSDFLIYDNGHLQSSVVDTLATGVAPIALIVAVQSSGISVPVLEKVQKIGAMIHPLITGERGCAGLVAFDERVHWLAECTRDPQTLTQAFRQLKPGEQRSACMLDAVHEAIERLSRRSNVRRVLLLISESRDRGSESELSPVVTAAQAAGVSVYASTYSAFRTAFTTKSSQNDPPPEPRVPRANRAEPMGPNGRVPIPPQEQRIDLLAGVGELTRLGKVKTTDILTKETGGVAFPFTRQKGLEHAIAKLGEELHSQYVLSFTPESPAPGYHPLEVRLSRQGSFRVRARPGYWSVH